jgi:hypothetical protein
METLSTISRIRGKFVRFTFAFAALAALLAGQIGPVAASQGTATAVEPITIETLGTGMPATRPARRFCCCASPSNREPRSRPTFIPARS